MSKKKKITENLMRLKYSTKFHLQLWAILSQLNEHEAALEDSKKASEFWQESLKASHDLCCEILKKKSTDEKYERKDKRVGIRKVSKSETRQSSFSDRPYDSKKGSMDKVYRKMKPQRMNRHEKFMKKSVRRNQLNFYKNNNSFNSK